MTKLRIKTDLVQLPTKGTVAINPTDIKGFTQIDIRHTWVELFSGRKYRTAIPIDELRWMLQKCRAEGSDKVESDKIDTPERPL